MAENQYSQPPQMQLDPEKDYSAIITMENGNEIEIELFAKEVPITVNNFVFLSREGYYDGITCHRVIPQFMVQSGDPTGTGRGGPGYQFQDEFVASLKHDSPGTLSMANSGPGTNGSQFFITHVPTPHLDGAHTVFGKVTSGMEHVLSIRTRDPMSDPKPGDAMKTIKINES